MFDFLSNEPFQQWFALIVPKERIFAAYLLSSLLLAYISYLCFRSSTEIEKPDTSKGFWKYVFGGEAYTHASARQDYLFFLTNAIVFYFFTAQFLLGQHVFTLGTYQGILSVFGTLESPVLDSLWSKIGYTMAAILAADFAVYITHYYTHKNPILWHFHTVHHSAEVLNPMTLHRMHPVDLAFSALVSALLIGISTGVFFYLSGGLPQEVSILGLNIVLFLFYVLGYNLRHSQIWLSWGKWASYIFISPAQHQIHHSVALKHRDRNFGLIFAFWDWMFGTLYVPQKYERLEYGIDKSRKNPFKSVTELYIMPFKWSWQSFRKGEGVTGFLVISFLISFIGFSFWTVSSAINARQVQTVFIEDLTWTEIARTQSKGYDSIIIPTGGTEQNGAHMITGKHNYIVKDNAAKIAKKDGHSLVAPVLAYVPEEMHAAYPGTVTIPQKAFEDILFAAGNGFFQQGFKYVFFIGDSLGNQPGQARAAERLNRRWKSKGVSAVHLTGYYNGNGQMEHLTANGYKQQVIGGHAGIRDTSELLLVKKDGVRKSGKIVHPPGGQESGSNGDYTKASSAIGKEMSKLKVDATLNEIKEARKNQAGASIR